MPPVSQRKRLEQVRERLEYVHGVYEARGIVGEQSQHYAQSDMRFLMDMYNGEHWNHVTSFGGLNRSDLVTVNKVFALANQFEAEVAARNPEVFVLPRGRNQERTLQSAQRAGAVQALINYDIEELDFADQTTDSFQDNFVSPFGAVRFLFTPESEHSDSRGRRLNRYRNERPDRPFIRRYAPWDCLIDPDANRFTPDGGMRYVFFRDYVSMESLRSNPNIRLPRNAKEMAGALRGRIEERPIRPEGGIGSGRINRASDPDDKSRVEVWTYYDAITRTWMQLTRDGLELPLRAEDDWTIEWEWLPLAVFVANRQRNSPFGTPILKHIAPLQEELNKTETMISWLAKSIRRLIGVDTSRMKPKEIRKLENSMLSEILEVEGPITEIVQNLQAGTLPQELLIRSARLEEHMRETLGLSLMGRGQRINVESAEEAARVGLGQDVNVGRVVRAYEKFWKHVVQTHHQARRQTMELTGSEVVRLLGTDADGALSTATVDPDDLHGDFDFVILEGSTRKRDPFREEQLAQARFLLAKQFPDILDQGFYARKLVEAQRFDPRDALTTFNRTAGALDSLARVRENQQRATPGEGPGPQGGEGTAAFLQALEGFGGTQ